MCRLSSNYTIAGECHILDNSTYEDLFTVALLQQENSYYLHHSSEEGVRNNCIYIKNLAMLLSSAANATIELPQCPQDASMEYIVCVVAIHY